MRRSSSLDYFFVFDGIMLDTLLNSRIIRDSEHESLRNNMNNNTNNITRKPVMQIVEESFAAGRKLSDIGFRQAGGSFGSYHYRRYVREFNKLQREADAKNVEQFVNDNTSLVTLLKRETETLRVQYIEMVKSWAKADYARIEKIAKSAFPKWDDYVKKIERREGQRFADQDYEGQKSYRKACDRRDACIKIVATGFEAYEAREVRDAEDHYQSAIIKLALRIEKKELVKSKITLSTSHIGVNIETVITDGTLTVRAWTIIASGPIQRPHFRYLVK